MSNKKFEFEAVLVIGSFKGTYANFPFDSAKIYGTRRPIPVQATFDESEPYFMNMLPNGKGGHWLHLKKDIRDAIGKREGDAVKVTVVKDDSTKAVAIQEYLQWLLDDDTQMKKYFKKLPYSGKKFWVNFIEEPKNDDVKVDRVNRLFQFLHEHYSGKN